MENGNKRPTFYYNGEQLKPIKAGGVIIYKIEDGSIKILLIKIKQFCKSVKDGVKDGEVKEVYEDIGGKTDSGDISFYDTVSREVAEETNNVINPQIIKHQLSYSDNLYIEHAKYLLYIIKANSYEKNLNTQSFGDKEIHDNIDRTIVWIDALDYLNNLKKFNPRLHSNEIKEYFKKLIKLS